MMRSSELRRIPPDHRRLVCKSGSAAETCRYITGTMDGVQCAKHDDLGRVIDERVRINQMRAQGDNCPGITRDNEAPETPTCS